MWSKQEVLRLPALAIYKPPTPPKIILSSIPRTCLTWLAVDVTSNPTSSSRLAISF